MEAFSQALRGSRAALESLKGKSRREVAQGFIRTLDSPDGNKAAQAAWALAELGAVEALPALRSKGSERHSADERTKDRWATAVAQLETLAALPRPAEAAPTDTGTLPRPASEPEPSTETPAASGRGGSEREMRNLFPTLVAVAFFPTTGANMASAEEGPPDAAITPGKVEPQGPERSQPKRVRDLLWVWGNPEMAEEGEHTLATFAQASPAERARLLGVPNVVMAGLGLPNDDREAEALTRQVADFQRLVWEVTPDGEGVGPPFVYRDRMAQVRRLVDRYPQIEGILLDDMSTGKIDRGFQPEHIRQIRELLPGKYQSVKVWGVVYTMSLEREGIHDLIRELDVIHLWTWHAQDVVDLEKNVAHCERLFPDKPIVLGLYLYDYGGGRRFPLDLLQKQCHTALQLAQAGRIEGLVFLTINNDPEAVTWVANWIKEVGAQALGSDPTQTPEVSE